MAVLGVVVLGVAIFALQNPRGAKHVSSPSTSSSPSVSGSSTTPNGTGSSNPSGPGTSADTSPATSGSTKPTLAEAQQVPLVVLNNTTVSGLAEGAAQRFENAGWTVTSYGNLTNDILSTCAYFDPSDPSAKPAAKVLKREFPTIKRVRKKFPQLPDGPIVVVLTPDYSAG